MSDVNQNLLACECDSVLVNSMAVLIGESFPKLEGLLFFFLVAGVVVESTGESKDLHKSPSTAGHFYGQRQCCGYRFPHYRILL